MCCFLPSRTFVWWGIVDIAASVALDFLSYQMRISQWTHYSEVVETGQLGPLTLKDLR